jgi:hypothetical protein
METYIDTRAASKLLGISGAAVARLAARGTLAFVWVAGRRVFRLDAVEALRDNHDYQARSRRPRPDWPAANGGRTC